MMGINKKLAFMLVIMILSIGIAAGTVLTADEQLDNLAASEQTINEKFAKEQANMQLYVMSADDVDTGERVHFYYRSDDNPFWRAHKIMEKEKINFENLVIRESDLLEEEK
jgi:hypothetical protein